MSKVIYRKSFSKDKVSYSFKENTVVVSADDVRGSEEFFDRKGFLVKNSRRKKLKKPTVVKPENLIVR